jgi:hypothetical protein
MARKKRQDIEQIEAEVQHGTGRSRQKDDRMKRIVKKHPPAGRPAPEKKEPEGEAPGR